MTLRVSQTPSAIMVPSFPFFASSRRSASKLVDRHTQQHSTPSPCVRPRGWSIATRSPLLPDLLLGPATRWRTAASVDFAKVRIGAAPSSGAGRRGPHTPLCYTNSHGRERGPGYCGWLAGRRAACRASAHAGPRSRRAGLSAVGLGSAAGFAKAYAIFLFGVLRLLIWRATARET